MKTASNPPVIAHNVYRVNGEAGHYMQCPDVREETLLEKVAVGAAFLLCVALLIFMG
jgi:hypothetical protein